MYVSLLLVKIYKKKFIFVLILSMTRLVPMTLITKNRMINICRNKTLKQDIFVLKLNNKVED